MTLEIPQFVFKLVHLLEYCTQCTDCVFFKQVYNF